MSGSVTTRLSSPLTPTGSVPRTVTRRIRRSPPHARLPVVALTSLSSSEHEAEGHAAGVTTYLVKLDDAALVAAVRQQAGATA
jgi:CheY-like chemotaxis protein